VRFDVVTATVEEHEASDADPRALVRHNARLKADWVADRHPAAFVLGADTTVCLDDLVLNKPADLADARRMLRLLSGRTHSVFTALACRHRAAGLEEDQLVESRVTFRDFDDATIDRYLRLAHTLDKAGAYGIQEHGDLIVAGWKGSFTNIVGLPVEATREILDRHGLLPSPGKGGAPSAES
jgi:septum formation protein